MDLNVHSDPFPYARGEGCDLCGKTGVKLKRLTLRQSGDKRRRREAWVCADHEEAVAPPVPVPHTSQAKGTSTRRPQRERLWKGAS